MKREVLTLLLATAGVAGIAAPAPCAAQETLTYADLVERMVDLQHLATLPPAGESCRLWSSWDRASQYDAASDRYVHWDANGDGNGAIRKEGDQIVMAEMEGPGCIFRTWSARAEEGHVKIYLDGQPMPVVDLPFRKYFSGDTAPFNFPILSYDLADFGCRGQNLYLPIPYQKSCKIVADPGWGAYYQFNYVTYPAGTKLPTFSPQLVAENAQAVEKVVDLLNNRLGTRPGGEIEGAKSLSRTIRVPAGGSAVAAEIAGPRAITAIRCRMKLADRADQMAALRQIVLKITWDGDAEPAVWCPLGDFFGTAPGENLYRTLPTGMTDDGYYAYWYMPFARQAKIELASDAPADREVELQIEDAPLTQPLEKLGRFHCKWHRDAHAVRADRWPDWIMLSTAGRGRFCGVMLHVWNPRGGWWGEGDEKFFVDGEKFPSTIGTGSEDYFGYAWCHPGLFQRPFHAQTMTMGNQGHQSVLRWHIGDAVPFQESFEAAIEKYYRTEERGTQYACTACWYLAPGGVDPYASVPLDDRHDYYANVPLRVGGFDIVGDPPGNVQTQDLRHFEQAAQVHWQGSDHLWWTGAKPGDRLEVAVPVKKAGRYTVAVVLTKARDYGIVQLTLDGKKAGDAIDLYNPQVVPTDPIRLGAFDLSEGKHTLGVEILGANEKADKAYMFGLDQVLFDEQE